MPAATDFVHDEELVDAILEHLGGAVGALPASWRTGEDPYFRLRALEFGDLRWLGPSLSGEGLRALCPAVVLRLRRSVREPQYGALGGKEGIVHPLRLVHVRWYDAADATRNQCRDTSDPAVLLSPVRAQAHYAKIVNRALFARRDLGNPALSTTDTSARVVESVFRQIVYEDPDELPRLQAPAGPVAFATDFDVIVRTQ